jgi:hypothetical protein
MQSCHSGKSGKSKSSNSQQDLTIANRGSESFNTSQGKKGHLEGYSPSAAAASKQVDAAKGLAGVAAASGAAASTQDAVAKGLAGAAAASLAAATAQDAVATAQDAVAKGLAVVASAAMAQPAEERVAATVGPPAGQKPACHPSFKRTDAYL